MDHKPRRWLISRACEGLKPNSLLKTRGTSLSTHFMLDPLDLCGTPGKRQPPVTSWQAWWIRTWHQIKLDLKETQKHFILYTSKIAELLNHTYYLHTHLILSRILSRTLFIFYIPLKKRNKTLQSPVSWFFCVPFFYILSPSKSAENNSFFLRTFLIIMSKAVYLLDSISRFYFDCTAEYIVE